MTDSELIARLHELGIDAASYRVVAMLPLVQVAWADDSIQKRERERILEAAKDFGITGDRGGDLLLHWLENRPNEAFFERARKLLVALSNRHRGIGEDMPADTLQRVQRMCVDVAASAGGLFDLVFTVSDDEKSALERISRSLAAHHNALFDDLPGPTDGSGYRDL